MKKTLEQFVKGEEGQDLVEYTLLMGVILMSSAAMLVANGGSIQGILFVTTTNLNAANSAAS